MSLVFMCAGLIFGASVNTNELGIHVCWLDIWCKCPYFIRIVFRDVAISTRTYAVQQSTCGHLSDTHVVAAYVICKLLLLGGKKQHQR